MQRIRYPTVAKTVLSIFLVTIILIVLLVQISIADILRLLTNISYTWFALGIIFYGITNFGRAVRLQILLPQQQTQLNRLFPIVIAQSMFNNILPSRLGELTLLYFLKKYESVPLDRSGVALVAARIFDYIAVACLFIPVALFIFDSQPAGTISLNIIWGAAGLMLLSIAALIGIAWQGQTLISLLQRLMEQLGLGSHSLVQKGVLLLNRLLAAFLVLHSTKRYFIVLGCSLFIWTSTFAWFYAFLQSMGIAIPFLNTIVGSTFAVLSKAIPFISVGGLGAHEAGWTAGFMLVGLHKTLAISSGFAVNILTLCVSVGLGAVSLGLLWWLDKRG